LLDDIAPSELSTKPTSTKPNSTKLGINESAEVRYGVGGDTFLDIDSEPDPKFIALTSLIENIVTDEQLSLITTGTTPLLRSRFIVVRSVLIPRCMDLLEADPSLSYEGAVWSALSSLTPNPHSPP
jgi:hypothetical protein